MEILPNKNGVALKKIIEVFCSDNCSIVEIGIDHAKTTLYLLQECQKIGKYYAIDPYIKRKGRLQTTIEQLSEFKKCVFIHEKSQNCEDKVPNDLDLIFIDGSHAYKDVLRDMEVWVSKVKSGGVVCGHDFCQMKPGVVRAVGEYIRSNANLFAPLLENSELERLGLSFERGGGNLIHKQKMSETCFLMWFVIKV